MNKLSIIVPVYNTEKFIYQCLNSIVYQITEETELILVDDGSLDNCPKICDDFALKNKNIKVIHKKNGGLVSARKAGLNICSGTYVSFIDSDDWVADDYVENLVALINLNYDIISFNFSIFKHNTYSKPESTFETGLYLKQDLYDKIYPKCLSFGKFFTFGIFPSVWSKCIKKDILMKYLDPLPEILTWGEDAAVSYPCLLNIDSLYISDYAGYFYRMNDLSITHSYDKNLIKKVLTLFDYLFPYFNSNDIMAKQFFEYIYLLSNVILKNEIVFAKKIDLINLKNYFNNEIVKKALNSNIFYKKLNAKEKLKLFLIRKERFYLLKLLLIKNR